MHLFRPCSRQLQNEDGKYWRDHLHALAQRVEVPSFIPKWRTRHDSNVWPPPCKGSALSN